MKLICMSHLMSFLRHLLIHQCYVSIHTLLQVTNSWATYYTLFFFAKDFNFHVNCTLTWVMFFHLTWGVGVTYCFNMVILLQVEEILVLMCPMNTKQREDMSLVSIDVRFLYNFHWRTEYNINILNILMAWVQQFNDPSLHRSLSNDLFVNRC